MKSVMIIFCIAAIVGLITMLMSLCKFPTEKIGNAAFYGFIALLGVIAAFLTVYGFVRVISGPSA